MDRISDLKGDNYWLLKIPGDGDCLFGSLVHQVYGVTPKNTLFKPYSKLLREIAVQEIRSHLEYYAVNLSVYAAELIPGDLSSDDKIEIYMRMLTSPGFWGGTECIAALSNHFKVSIRVYQDNAYVTFNPTEIGNAIDTFKIYKIFYHGNGECDGHEKRTHYDSIVFIRPSYLTLSAIPNSTLETVHLADRDFKAECISPLSVNDSLIISVGHQLTGTSVDENTIILVRCLLADECQVLPSTVLSLLNISEEDLATFVICLKTGQFNGGRNCLILLSSLMDLHIYLHSPGQETVRYSPASRKGSLAIHLVESDGNSHTRYMSVLRIVRCQHPTSIVPRDEPIIIAEKIARVEICATPPIHIGLASFNEKVGLRFASMNINGCRSAGKRAQIDSFLLEKNVHCAALQEVNLESTDVMTANYRWYMGQMSKGRKRGLAILVRFDADIIVKQPKNYGVNILFVEIAYKVEFNTRLLYIANVHGPNQRSSGFFAALGSIIRTLKDPRRLLIAGDFNSQLGNEVYAEGGNILIGKYVGHDHFNENGQQMRFFLNLHLFVIRSTTANASFLKTWISGNRSSQIDHILTHLHSSMYLKRMQCTIPGDVPTDHKILLCNIVENRTVSKILHSNVKVYQRSDINPSLLLNKKIQKDFAECLRSYGSCDPEVNELESIWAHLKTKMYLGSNSVLKRSTGLSPTRECRLALANVKRLIFWTQRNVHPKWSYKLMEAKSELRLKIREAAENKIIDFFKNLQQYPLGQRINRTYKYFKRYSKRSKNAWVTTFRLHDWVQDTESTEVMIPACLNEPISLPVVGPPTLEEIKSILFKTKNGKAPGVDGLYSEFYKYCDDDTLVELHKLLVRVFIENKLPSEWKKVVLVPIPKVKRPKSTDEFRRISLTCTAYKIYASWILSKLQIYIGPIGNHQAAFLPGRSTTDHLHVLQRVLQESWNEGKTVVLMSLDIEKAFDRVSLLSLPSILQGKGVPLYLINRVIQCLQDEQQQVLWQRQLTQPTLRTRGVKQGCPLSPYLFNLIMEAVLESVEDEVNSLRLNQESQITLPLVLVFADDIIIVSDSVDVIEQIMSHLKEYLSYVGLNLNEEKCKVLIREPNAAVEKEEVEVLGRKYRATGPLRYLGVYFTARLHRPLTTRTRCRTTVRTSQLVLDFLKKYKPSWQVAKTMYETVIAPSMIYGTQTSVLTKYSRRSLRGYERQIVQSMFKHCNELDRSQLPKSVKLLLNKRRVTKKVRMYQMRWWGHVRRRCQSHPLRAAARLRADRLRPCRPSFTWWDSILQTMQRYGGITYEEWKQMAINKDHFHKKLLEIYDRDESDNTDSDWETDSES